MALRREPVSIICVFNDPEVRSSCLDRSIEVGRNTTPDVEYLPIDNVESSFSSAGAALNHGAKLARHEYLAFVHQDVYLHSLDALEEAAGLLADDGSIGLLGAIGIAADARLHGQIRDRVVLLGESAPRPVELDSIDEVLFMIPRAQLLAEPLAEVPELAWHAYGVEYGLRMRGIGKRVAAVDLRITHNSLTINLAKLDVAHAEVGARYPTNLPVRTTCGTITSPVTGSSRSPFLASQRWRYPWLKESAIAHRGRRAARGGRFVLSDIRRDIDDAIAGNPLVLTVVNVSDDGAFAEDHGTPLSLTRRAQPVELASIVRAELSALLSGWVAPASMLVTNLRDSDFQVVAARLGHDNWIAGYHEGIGFWLLIGAATETLLPQWRSRRARPFGMPKIASTPTEVASQA